MCTSAKGGTRFQALVGPYHHSSVGPTILFVGVCWDGCQHVLRYNSVLTFHWQVGCPFVLVSPGDHNIIHEIIAAGILHATHQLPLHPWWQRAFMIHADLHFSLTVARPNLTRWHIYRPAWIRHLWNLHCLKDHRRISAAVIMPCSRTFTN